MTTARFAAPTAALDLERLLAGLRRASWASLSLAAAAHLLIVGINPFQQTLDKTPRPLTTRFIKRQPRLTKPLELRKVPKPQRQLLRRQVALLSARMDQVRAAATFSTRGVLQQVAAPAAAVDQAARFASLQLEPGLQAELIRGARQPESKVDLALEMLDIDAMDTGRYRAMVIQDPADPQGLKGFVKVARVYSEIRHGNTDRSEMYRNLAIRGLVDNLNRYTGIRAQCTEDLTFDDSRLLGVPFILYISLPRSDRRATGFTDREMEGAARYLMAGGFILGRADWTEELEKHGGLMRGRDFHNGRLPSDHPIYCSFFNMGPSGVPLPGGAVHSSKQLVAVATYLDGLWIGDRLAAVEGIDPDMFGCGVRWGADTTRHLQLGVNIMVFALTQEGSVTQRLMQLVQ